MAISSKAMSDRGEIPGQKAQPLPDCHKIVLESFVPLYPSLPQAIGQCPVEVVPAGLGHNASGNLITLTTRVHKPYRALELDTWKNSGPYRQDPRRIADLCQSIFATTNPSYVALLDALLTYEE